MQKEFYIHQNGENKGPYTLDVIIDLASNDEFFEDDYIYVDAKKDWIFLKDYEPLSACWKKSKTKSVTLPENHKSQEWYVLKWDNKYGPFSYLELIKMLQNKAVFEFDYIWKQGLDNWLRIAECKDFMSPKIKQLYKSEKEDPAIKDVFFRRRHERKNFNGSIIIHDNDKVWKGSAIEVSEGGAGIIMNNAMIQPGEKVFLHFKPGDDVPPFNAICEIVSKKFAKGVNDRYAPVKYGVKFIKIHTHDLDSIKKYIKKAS